eukprot:754435-Hanusia_phi.AAC.4
MEGIVIPDDESSIVQPEGFLPSGHVDSVQLDMSQVWPLSVEVSFACSSFCILVPDPQTVSHRLCPARGTHLLELSRMEEVLQVDLLRLVRGAG